MPPAPAEFSCYQNIVTKGLDGGPDCRQAPAAAPEGHSHVGNAHLDASLDDQAQRSSPASPSSGA